MTAMSSPSSSESDWYEFLVALHGREHVGIGSIAHTAQHVYWLSARSDPRATEEEHQRFYSEGERMIAEFHKTEVPFLSGLEIPSLLGDFFGERTELLNVKATSFKTQTSKLCTLLSRIREFLQSPENRLWRVGCFDPLGSLIVYPDCIFVGEHRHDSAARIETELEQWLAMLTAEDPQATKDRTGFGPS